MSDLSPRARELIRRASRGGGPSERQRQSVKAAVTAAALAPAAAVAGTGLTTAKLLLVGVVSVAAGAGVMGGAVATSRLVQRPAVTAAPRSSHPAAPPPAPLTGSSVQVFPKAPPAEPPPVVRAEPSPAPLTRATAPRPAAEALVPEPRQSPAAPPLVPEAPLAPTTEPESKPAAAPVEPGRDEPPAVAARVREAPPLPAPEPPARAPRAADPEGLRRELEALDRAVRAVDEERFAEGLAAARAFQGQYPRSEFATEARVVEVLALCGLARVDEARSVSAALPTSAAGNPALRRLEHSCAR